MTRAGWAVAAMGVLLGASGVVAHQPALLVLAVGCLAALICSVVTKAVRPRLDLERRLGRSRVTAGEGIAVALVVTNASARPSAATVAVDSLEGEPVRVAIPAMGGHGSRTVGYDLPAGRRGVFTLAPLVVSRPDPLGLTRIAPLTSDEDLTVWVHPRTIPVAPIPAGYQLSEDGPRGSDVQQGALVFHSLREYVVGDDIRHIHWRSSAHAGDLLVRETLETTTPTAAVVLDTRRGVHTEASFEEAIEIAASLVTASLPHGVPVILATTGGRSLSAADSEDALDELAAVTLDDGDEAALSGLGRSGSPTSRSNGLVFVTGSPGAADAAAIAELCARTANTTVVLVGDGSTGSDARQRGRADLSGVTATIFRVDTSSAFAALWNQRHR